MVLNVVVAADTVLNEIRPQPLRLIGLHGRPTDFLDQQARYCESLVAYCLCRQTEARAARQQAILRIPLLQLGCCLGGLTIGGTGDNQPLHRADIPTASYEFGRKPVEQLRIGWRVALRAEVIHGFYDSLTKIHLPEAIYRHAGRQGIGWIDDPFCQAEPILWEIRRHRRQNGWYARSH